MVAAAAGGGGGSGVKLAGVGSSVPEKFLTNDDLAQLVDTSDEWIISRTGIKKRHILSEGESLGSHAAAASRRALEMAGAVRARSQRAHQSWQWVEAAAAALVGGHAARCQLRSKAEHAGCVPRLHGLAVVASPSFVPPTHQDQPPLLAPPACTPSQRSSALSGVAAERVVVMLDAPVPAGVAAEEVELVIMATSSPDDLFGSATTVQVRAGAGTRGQRDVGSRAGRQPAALPTKGSHVLGPWMQPACIRLAAASASPLRRLPPAPSSPQAAIGATGAAAFDLTAACSGFVMGLVTGAQYIKAGTYKTVLVIGAWHTRRRRRKGEGGGGGGARGGGGGGGGGGPGSPVCRCPPLPPPHPPPRPHATCILLVAAAPLACPGSVYPPAAS